jgi:hypothetical protein
MNSPGAANASPGVIQAVVDDIARVDGSGSTTAKVGADVTVRISRMKTVGQPVRRAGVGYGAPCSPITKPTF